MQDLENLGPDSPRGPWRPPLLVSSDPVPATDLAGILSIAPQRQRRFGGGFSAGARTPARGAFS